MMIKSKKIIILMSIFAVVFDFFYSPLYAENTDVSSPSSQSSNELPGSENNYESGGRAYSGPSSTVRFWRTLGEITFINGIGVANYWINKNANIEDWRYKPNFKDAKRKILDGWYFDQNAFRTNTLYHFYGGALYYQTGRSNGYGIPASVIWACTGSFIWEYIGEFREQVSANDMIYTTMGGALLGEAFRTTSIYLEAKMPPGIISYFLVILLDPMRILNRAVDRCLYKDININVNFMNPADIIVQQPFRNHISWSIRVQW